MLWHHVFNDASLFCSEGVVESDCVECSYAESYLRQESPFAECSYSECHYAQCYGATFLTTLAYFDPQVTKRDRARQTPADMTGNELDFNLKRRKKKQPAPPTLPNAAGLPENEEHFENLSDSDDF